MKKKLLEKDAFYLSLFPTNSQDEIHLTEDEKNDVLPTTTDSDQNLAKAKEAEHNKVSYLGNQVIRSYSEKEPSYS